MDDDVPETTGEMVETVACPIIECRTDGQRTRYVAQSPFTPCPKCGVSVAQSESAGSTDLATVRERIAMDRAGKWELITSTLIRTGGNGFIHWRSDGSRPGAHAQKAMRLASKAPELLAALKALINAETDDDEYRAIEVAKELIEKTEKAKP